MLSRQLRGSVVDVMAEDWQLVRELEAYAWAEAQQKRREAAKAEDRSKARSWRRR